MITEITTVVKADEGAVLDVLGPRIEPLTSPQESAYCVMKGTLPPGISVPLLSHEDAESFYVLCGEIQGLVQTKRGLEWQTLKPGDFVHITSAAKHAWRNLSQQRSEVLITCTAKLGRFLREVGRPASDRRTPTQEQVQGLAEISERYGYWMGSPEENAAVGISLL